MSRFDVLVVGGGPAGSIASLVLSQGGVDVALIDKSTFPRDKACGDVVGPRGLQVLSDLGLAAPDAIIASPARSLGTSSTLEATSARGAASGFS